MLTSKNGNLILSNTIENNIVISVFVNREQDNTIFEPFLKIIIYSEDIEIKYNNTSISSVLMPSLLQMNNQSLHPFISIVFSIEYFAIS